MFPQNGGNNMANKFRHTDVLAKHVKENSNVAKEDVNGALAVDIRIPGRTVRVYRNGSIYNMIGEEQVEIMGKDVKKGNYPHTYIRLKHSSDKICVYAQTLIGLAFNMNGYEALLNNDRAWSEGIVNNHITSDPKNNDIRYLEWCYTNDNILHGRLANNIRKLTGYTYWFSYNDIEKYETMFNGSVRNIQYNSNVGKNKLLRFKDYLDHMGITAVRE